MIMIAFYIRFQQKIQDNNQMTTRCTVFQHFLIFALVACVFAQGQAQYGYSSTSTASTCIQNCLGDEQCIASCTKFEQSVDKTRLYVGISITIVIVIAIFIIIIFIACFFPCLFCPCHFYQLLKIKQNEISTKTVSMKDYLRQRNQIIKIMNMSQNNADFTYEQQKKIYTSKMNVKIIKQKPFLTQLKIQGQDQQFGLWTAYGFILQHSKGIKFWMYKMYKDKKKCIQTGSQKHLVFKMKEYKAKKMIKGNWKQINQKQKSKQIIANQKCAPNSLSQKWKIIVKQNCNDLIKNSQIITQQSVSSLANP